jgi:hypothetical protein
MIIKFTVICNKPSTQGFLQKTLIKFCTEYILHSTALYRKVKGHYILHSYILILYIGSKIAATSTPAAPPSTKTRIGCISVVKLSIILSTSFW